VAQGEEEEDEQEESDDEQLEQQRASRGRSDLCSDRLLVQQQLGDQRGQQRQRGDADADVVRQATRQTRSTANELPLSDQRHYEQ